MDPDREALREAIRCFEDRAVPDPGDCSTVKDCRYQHVALVVAAARRDLARLEGEKPKKASLGELVEHLSQAALENQGSKSGVLDAEAAAVLRAVGEFAAAVRSTEGRMRERAQPIFDKAITDLCRSLP